MTIKEFYAVCKMNGRKTDLNDDVNVYLNDWGTQKFNDLVVKCGNPKFSIGSSYLVGLGLENDYVVLNLNNECEYKLFWVNRKINGDTEISDVYKYLIEDMESKSNK